MTADTLDRPRMRPSIERITAYTPGESKLPGHDTVIKLASNESALGPSPKALEASAMSLARTHLYPDPAATALRRAIGAHYDIPPEHLITASGSEQLLTLIIRAFAGPGDEVLQPEHAFLVYRIAALSVGAEPVFAPERDVHADVDALLERVTECTRIVAVANPGNPTGTWIPTYEIQRLRNALRPEILLIIDSAYGEYPTDPAYSDGHALVQDAIDSGADNVVVTHTFSKIYGLAGLRVGWGYGPPAVLDPLHRIREVFNVTMAGQAAAEAAIADRAHVQAERRHVAAELMRLADYCRRRGLKLSPSGTNFGLIQFDSGEEAERCNQLLRDHGIIVRPVAGYGLPHCLRVTLGRTDQMDRFYEAFDAF
ncbi:MAG: pyridoxal phosphate-dependent aminotransferase [Rhodothalassiaceae bacterium]